MFFFSPPSTCMCVCKFFSFVFFPAVAFYSKRMADRDGLHGAARVQQLVANKRAADIPATVAMALGETETEFSSDITLKFAG